MCMTFTVSTPRIFFFFFLCLSLLSLFLSPSPAPAPQNNNTAQTTKQRMEIFSIVWQFLLLWAFIYTVVFLIQCISTRKKDPNMFNKRQRSSNNNTLLPFTIVDESTAPVIEQDQWSIKLFQVKYTTQRLNRFFASLTQFAPNFWRVWFSLGVLTAVVLMVVGMGVIVYAGFKILSSFGGHVFSSSNSSEGGGRLSKRGFEEGQETEDQVFLPMVT